MSLDDKLRLNWKAQEKKCNQCGTVKPLDEFKRAQDRGKSLYFKTNATCRECALARNKEYRDNVKEANKTAPPIKRREKNCCQCGEKKSLDEYDRNQYNPDGRQSYCKECASIYHIRRRKKL